MQENNQANNKRLARNTIVLYFRTIIVMLVSLYTSRVILAELGVEDFGIYNVVGGVIAMFSVVSGSISNAISRFITYELGKGNSERLKEVFCTSVNIQVGIGLLVVMLGETIGLWFLNVHMNIPEGRTLAANWVLQCSLLAFVINLLSIPYNACIIAHERMTAFAYIGILDVVMKLLVVLILPFVLVDKLIVYSLLIVLVAIIVRIIYAVYCTRNFTECRYCFIYNKALLRQMAGFSGWQFLTNTCWIVNTQGVNVLSNIYFGVTVNAARGIAHQVEGAVLQFVGNFMTALNPQLVKSYAQGDQERFFKLICRGAKFSYYLLLLMALPVLFETEFLLGLWLKEVPEYSVLFVRLSIIAALSNMLGNTSVAACMATGDLKRYTIIISAVGYTVFPLTWIVFKCGYGPEYAYIVFIFIYFIIIFVRLYVMKGLINFPPMLYIQKVLVPIIPVTAMAVLIPSILNIYYEYNSFLQFVIISIGCVCSSIFSIYLIGLSVKERRFIATKSLNLIKSKFRKQ